MEIKKFKKTIWDYYKKNKRSFPWRKIRDPYKILVSEIMLQQTQAKRVVPKYNSFLKKFPTTKVLAKAKLSEVLKEWQGLGYNRRAKYLKDAAEQLESEFGGKFPKTLEALVSLPGIGPATAGDILAFSWNIPTVLVETNIRSVFIHFFFKGARADTYARDNPRAQNKLVHDRDLFPLIEKTLDMQNPREWYWALFDYGAHLKETNNPSRKSSHHVKQTRFIGSHREKRAQILKLILKQSQTQQNIVKTKNFDAAVITKILTNLQKEGLIKKSKNKFFVD